MAREGVSSVKAQTAPDPDDPRKPQNPTDLKKPSIKHTFKRALDEFKRDQGPDLAAALTYYAVLSLFPALLALTSLLGVLGAPQATVNAFTQLLEQAGQSDVARQLEGPIRSMSESGAAGFTLVAGIAGAIWAASKYVIGFGRAMTRIYQVDEGRPIWKLRPQMLLIPIALLAIAMVVILSVALSGQVAHEIGSFIGLGEETVRMWNIAKWPFVLLLVVIAVAILYHWTPNVQQPKFRWVSVGALFAIVVWTIASVGFGFYVSNFSNYEATYGSLAGIIIFLLWLWLTNSVLLLGAEIDAELERARQLQAGIEAERTLQLPPRDTRQSDKAAEKLAGLVEEGRELRLRARAAGATGHLAPAAGTDGKSAAEMATADSSPASAGFTGDSAGLEPLPSEVARQRGD